MSRIEIEIIIYGSKEDKDVKVVMEQVVDVVFGLEDYNVQHVIIKRSRFEKLIRWIRKRKLSSK